MMYSLLVVLIIAIGSALAGGGIGWAVKGWKDGEHVAVVESRDVVLTSANEKCSIDIGDVQKGVKSVTEYMAVRMKAAEDAAAKATTKAGKHSGNAITIMAAPLPPEDKQCVAIKEEQEKYVQSRHTGS
jgi:hypothetical protein